MGCEHAISKTDNYIEKGILEKEDRIGVFIDIKGAFDNVCLDGIARALSHKNVPEPIISWYLHFISNRICCFRENRSMRYKISRGTPQGGVLSPLIWNLVLDQILEVLTPMNLKLTAYCTTSSKLALQAISW